MTRQETLTVVVELAPAEVAKVKSALLAVPDRIGQPRPFKLGSIHFARLFVIEEPDESEYRSWLVLESNFDTREADPAKARAAHLRDLARESFRDLGPIFDLSARTAAATPEELGETLVANLASHAVRYQGHVLRDVSRVLAEAKLRRFALDFVARRKVVKGEDARWTDGLWKDLFEAATKEPELAPLELTGPAPDTPSYALRSKLLRMATVKTYLGAWKPLLRLALRLPGVIWHQIWDRQFQPQHFLETRTDRARRLERENAESEDWMTQNALTHLVPLRGGFWRDAIRVACHDALATVASSHFDFTGELGGIPTIHFAKWLLVDGGKRLLFLSNYDGNWESYIGDFVDQAASGLNLAWACSEEYPKTKLILGGGAADEERFKVWTRAYQRPTQIFYSAYPELSVGDINQATWIRHGLHRRPPEDLETWARRLV